MSFWISAPLFLVGIIGISAIAMTIWNPFNQNLSREDFPDLIRDLLIGMENGAYSRLDSRQSKIWFSFERLSGTDTEATLALRIPRTDESERLSGELRRIFDSQGYVLVDEVDNPSLLAKVLVPVADIWEKNSGTTGAHAARLYLETVGIPMNARFRLTALGKVSRRLEKEEFFDRV